MTGRVERGSMIGGEEEFDISQGKKCYEQVYQDSSTDEDHGPVFS